MERYQDQPFGIFGINTDGDPDEYRRNCDEFGVTWKSSFQGDTSGPVCEAWGVTAYPTLYILDGEGRIRFKDSRAVELEMNVAALMAEASGEGITEEQAMALLAELGYIGEDGEPVAGAGVVRVELEAVDGEPEEELVESVPTGLIVPAAVAEDLGLLGQVQALDTEYEAADAAWNEAWRAVSGKERRDLRKADPAQDFYARYRALADQGSGDAKLWLAIHLKDATQMRSTERSIALAELYEDLVGNYGAGRLGAAVVNALVHNGRRVERFQRARLLEQLADQVSDRGAAAKALDYSAGLLDSKKATDEQRAHGLELTDRLLSDYLDTSEGVVIWGKRNRGVYKGVGEVIPNFPAVDTAGQPFRIDDYKGQVVMLDFWGFW